MSHYAPGMRVIIRDAEWVIRRVDNASDGGQQLECSGVSELVRDKDSIFLTNLETTIEIIDPEKTVLVSDSSPGYANSLLYIESLLRRRAINDDKIHIAHKGAMDSVPYQLDPALQSLKQPRQRILIADAVGLGKTLEAGILVSELIYRGRGKRILVLTQKSMLTQFQKEFWNRFTIPLTRLDSQGLQRVRNRIPTNHNPFYYYDKSIISIDTLKQDSEYRVYLEQAYWDIIVIDECHNVADRGNSSQRARLAKLLATRSDTLIMLSATPHDGRARSFASLMNMLDPTAITDPENYVSDDFSSKGLVIRRFKQNIQHQVDSEFKERKIFKYTQTASHKEEAAYETLLRIPFTRAGDHDENKSSELLRVTFEKSLFSSPAACRKSISERVKKLKAQLEKSPNDAVTAEINELEYLDTQLVSIDASVDSKYQKLQTLIKSKDFNWKMKAPDDRIVIFSERIETLHFLHEQLKKDLKLKDPQVQIMHGGMPDIELQEIVEEFGKPESKLRLLLCSDVASEGINLHYQSHRLIHYDMPWSLMVFQQRNGRVDRYGQEKEPEIYYLLTDSQNQTIRGDMRILEILQEKDEQAYKNIDDPSAFMGVYDARLEEEITKQAMAGGKQAEEFDQQLQIDADKKNPGADILASFMAVLNPENQQNTKPEVTKDTKPQVIEEGLSLYEDDYRWSKAALRQIQQTEPNLQCSFEDENHRISLTAPDDLRYRFKHLPIEIKPEHFQFVLSDDEDIIKAEISRSREDENAWPKIHYLWPQHPVSEWLQDRMLSSFGRQTAPVIRLPMGATHGLVDGEAVFVISGLIPNRKSHPLIHEWLGVCFKDNVFSHVELFSETLQRTALGKIPIPNQSAESDDFSEINALIPEAVQQAKALILEKRKQFEDHVDGQLNDQLKELEVLRSKQIKQLELVFDQGQNKAKQARKVQQAQDINKIFDDYIEWIQDTMTTENQPYMQVIAVIVNRQGEG